jgi:hypothetical protein
MCSHLRWTRSQFSTCNQLETVPEWIVYIGAPPARQLVIFTNVEFARPKACKEPFVVGTPQTRMRLPCRPLSCMRTWESR